ncbi:MAG TPA: DUF3823 domain-containing protein [Mucilaginibacter sp.]|nr:DUF3823 domain-containing protein [Mucilaginibacter sp.]
MKKIVYYIALCLVIIAGSSCSKLDNYPAPAETLAGSVTDATTNEAVQTEIGSGGTRIKLLEVSYSANPTPQYLNSRQDGTYTNTKIFAGKYIMSAEGPFVPLVLTNSEGDTVSNKSQTVQVKGVTTVNFKVEPFIKIESVGAPVLNGDGTISVQVKLTRGTTNADFQQNITDAWLFVSNTQFDGNNNYDPRYSTQITYDGSAANAILGQTITITTKGGQLPAKTDFFVRVGARIDYGLKQYNYNAPQKVTTP